MKIVVLHGWQSVPGGVKPSYLAQHGHEVINPELPHEDFTEAVRIAQAEFRQAKSAGRHRIEPGRGRSNERQQRRGKARLALPGVEKVRDRHGP